jgi:hypothetical protein
MEHKDQLAQLAYPAARCWLSGSVKYPYPAAFGFIHYNILAFNVKATCSVEPVLLVRMRLDH